MDIIYQVLSFTTAHIGTLKLSEVVPKWIEQWKVSLNGLAILSMAESHAIQRRAASTGTSALLDALVLAPGLHLQQSAQEVNKGEYPACGAMTTGYVFRVENEATVAYLQRVGRTGHLTTLQVSNLDTNSSSLYEAFAPFYELRGGNTIATIAYLSAVGLTLIAILLLYCLQDPHALRFIGILIFIRTLNVMVMRERAVPGWFGAKEPGIESDLLVLMSKDRWIRLQGLTDDMKAVTSGSWLKEMEELSMIKRALISSSILLVALNAGFALAAKPESQLLLIILLCSCAGLLGLANECTDSLQMHGRLITLKHPPVAYNRRLDLAKELIVETENKDSLIFGRKAALKRTLIRMAVLQPDQANELDKAIDAEGAATM